MNNRMLLSVFFLMLFLSYNTDNETVSIEEVDNENESFYQVEGYVKIENGSGGLVADLDSGDRFDRDHDAIGDVNGDGVIDFVLGHDQTMTGQLMPELFIYRL